MSNNHRVEENEEKQIEATQIPRPMFTAAVPIAGSETDSEANKPKKTVKKDVNCCFARHCLCWMDWVESLLNKMKTT